MSRNKIIAVSIVGAVTVALIVTVIILAIVPSAMYALVRNDGILAKPTRITTYRYIDGVTAQKNYDNDEPSSDIMKSRYNGILDRLNHSTGSSILSGLFSQNKASAPKVENIDASNQYWSSLKDSKATEEKIIIVLTYTDDQTVKDKDGKDVKFNRAFIQVEDTSNQQTLKIYLLEGNSTPSKHMITYTGVFDGLFDYVMGLPTGATPI